MWPKFGRGMTEGWLALVRNGERLDVAHVISSAGKRPSIRVCESFRVEGTEVDALSRLAQSRGLKQHRCVTLLSEDAYRMAQIEAPSVPAEERIQAVRWRMKDLVDFPVEGAAIAVADIPAEGRLPNVFAIAAPATIVAERMALFSDAKLHLDAIDIPEMALRNVAALFEEPNRGLAFLAMVDGDSILTITCGGELFLARRIELSISALAAADEARRQQMIERLALELQRTLDNFDRQYGFVSVSRLMVTAEHDPAGLVSQLANNLYLPVQAMDLANVVDFPDLPELKALARQGQCILAIGAALRSPS